MCYLLCIKWYYYHTDLIWTYGLSNTSQFRPFAKFNKPLPNNAGSPPITSKVFLGIRRCSVLHTFSYPAMWKVTSFSSKYNALSEIPQCIAFYTLMPSSDKKYDIRYNDYYQTPICRFFLPYYVITSCVPHQPKSSHFVVISEGGRGTFCFCTFQQWNFI